MTTGQEERAAERFRQAAALLPAWLRGPLERLPREEQALTEEIRLRAGRAMTVGSPAGEKQAPGSGEIVRSSDLSLVLEVATRASAHTALDRVQTGFFTVRGGHRIGLCGSAVVREGAVHNLRQLSSLSIRVAREVPGVAEAVLEVLRRPGGVHSTLILSPPGGGKTTLLRALVRSLSDGVEGPALRVGLADERSEVAALWEGMPQLDVGGHTDILDGCPKAAALMMLLRGMNPQVLAADEITAPEDAEALEAAANCGVSLLATAHGTGPEDPRIRPLYRRLLERKVFQRLVVIRRAGPGRVCEVRSLEGERC